MNNVAFTEVMIWIFGFVALITWLFDAASKDIAKKREVAKGLSADIGADEQSNTDTSSKIENDSEYFGGFIVALIGLVFSIVMHISYKSDYNALLAKFKKGDDIYCYSSTTDSKWEKVNKNDGWYLEEDTLKHKDKGLKFGIHRCKESF